MSKDLPHFGLLLRYYREDAGWSQPELARQLSEKHGYSISASAINKYELGMRRPGGDFIAHLERCFQLSEEEAANLLQALSTDYLVELIDQYQQAKQSIEGEENDR